MNLLTRVSLTVSSISLICTLAPKALADHSLAVAMSDSPAIAAAVREISSFNGVVCDVDNSQQSDYYFRDDKRSGSAWKQIALCFRDTAGMDRARKYFQQGGELGFYGAPDIVGVLVVAYTWEDYQAGKLISINYF